MGELALDSSTIQPTIDLLALIGREELLEAFRSKVVSHLLKGPEKVNETILSISDFDCIQRFCKKANGNLSLTKVQQKIVGSYALPRKQNETNEIFRTARSRRRPKFGYVTKYHHVGFTPVGRTILQWIQRNRENVPAKDMYTLINHLKDFPMTLSMLQTVMETFLEADEDCDGEPPKKKRKIADVSDKM